MIEIQNLLRDASPDTAGESIELLLQHPCFKLERIVSRGKASPPGFWYDQEWNEWVCLVQGEARLLMENGETLDLATGSCLIIPARRRHRVEQVSDDAVWLALHLAQP